MPENYEIRINKFRNSLPDGDEESVKVRFIGFIDERECEALMNVQDAFRKLSTAENEDLQHFLDVYKKRFVLVISRPSEAFGEKTPSIFVSAHVIGVSYLRGSREFKCDEKDDNGKNVSRKFLFIPIENKKGA
jgi:hypothetical protein